MKSSKIHPVSVSDTSGGRELGRQVMAMRYDKVLEAINGMKVEAARQRDGDAQRGYVKLSKELNELQQALAHCEAHLEKIVEICRPHILLERRIAEAGAG